jgi:TRAP transporter TAXI family solute receptor
VRARLLALLLVLMSLVLAVLCVPLSRGIVATRQQAMFVDRLQDATRFAYEAQQFEVDDQSMAADLARYGDVFGIPAALLDRSGAVKASSQLALRLTDPAVADAVSRALAGHPTQDEEVIWPWQHRPLVVAVPVVRGDDVVGAVLIVSPTGALRAATASDLALVLIAAAFALLLCVALANRLASWLLRPIEVLDGAAAEIRTGTLSARVDHAGGPIELRTLARSFNAMADAVQDAMRRRRDFVADASHQLRNPLTVMQLRLEGLRLDLPESGRQEVGEILDEAERLRTIVDELLELATAQQVTAHPVPLDLSAVTAAAVGTWQAWARSRGVDLILTGDAAAGTALGDPTLLGSALDAVLDNAIKFTPEGGAVRLRIVQHPDTVGVIVHDGGPGLPSAELSRVGDRFWRSPAHQNVPGSGLGLSIARSLLAATGGQLRFAAGRPSGLAVTITLPRQTQPVPAPEAVPVAPVQRPRRRGTGRRLVTIGALSAVLLATALGSAAAEPAQPPAPGAVVIATGGTKGVYFQYAQSLVRASHGRLGQVRLLDTSGSVHNVGLLAQGQATFAICAADAAMDGYAGRGPFGEPVPLRAVARLYDDYIHLVVPAPSAVHSLGDLRGLRVSMGPEGSGTAVIADRLFGVAGLDPHRDIDRRVLGINDSVAALQAGTIDAFFWSGGLFTGGITELGNSMAVRLVSLGEAATALRTRYGGVYRTGTIPAGTYRGVDSTVTTVAVPNLLVTRDSTSAATVQRVLDALFASAAQVARDIPAAVQLDPRSAAFTGRLPLHPTATSYYRTHKTAT